jgi:hypothetical protein
VVAAGGWGADDHPECGPSPLVFDVGNNVVPSGRCRRKASLMFAVRPDRDAHPRGDMGCSSNTRPSAEASVRRPAFRAARTASSFRASATGRRRRPRVFNRAEIETPRFDITDSRVVVLLRNPDATKATIALPTELPQHSPISTRPVFPPRRHAAGTTAGQGTERRTRRLRCWLSSRPGQSPALAY